MLLSVIVPVVNEAENLRQLLPYLRENAGHNHQIEVIVVDGGSTDETIAVARSLGAWVVHSDRSRSRQMNAGARAASGQMLYFVHADTFPPVGFATLIFNTTSTAGCFTSIFDWNHPFLRFCNWFSRLPFIFCRGGGQTLFVQRWLFEKLGGFNESMRVMEEYEFIQRITILSPFTIIRKPAITSARDYRVNGAFRLQAIYGYVFFLYLGGSSQEKLLHVIKRYVKKAR